ncbi:antibiotic biosynthesis monooxygenase [Bacillus sp. 165]|uniref:antibiotic biosynthesis monooxygenase family protein n=1 Tax=Bacillus sp. 165 TaxID=1529117 RepID=UPI001ADAD4AD|nr:antibiotic biosynthesis monooxygenase [Bacillus sp. 165]MBO9130584.1 antibiotic biosynthesis monooxygenase [Bacillus sp. 165]
MVLETATLYVKEGMEHEFKAAFQKASVILSSMNGYISHKLLKCIEAERKYLLLVEWETLEDHTIGFRTSKEYQTWRGMLHHFYEPFPVVEHFEDVSYKKH